MVDGNVKGEVALGLGIVVSCGPETVQIWMLTNQAVSFIPCGTEVRFGL